MTNSDTRDEFLLLDIRAEADFLSAHDPRAANIPLEQLADRIHELPKKHAPLNIFDAHPTRARWACSRLRSRGYESLNIINRPDLATEWITGPSQVRLWRPHDWLTHALNVIAAHHADSQTIPPAARRALDLACGCGRDAVHLALHGWTVTAWDILPDALARAADLAQRSAVPLVTRQIDVERDPWPPGDTFDLVIVFNFLHRPLFNAIRANIRPGGFLIYETFVDPQREKFGKPRRAEHVLRSGELKNLFADWHILDYREHLAGPRRYAAGILAQKPDRL